MSQSELLKYTRASLIFPCRWFCHFDDDVYVNIPMLIDTLSKYKPSQEKVYIGRWPLAVEEIQVPKRFFLEAFPIHVCVYVCRCSWYEV